MKGRKIAEDAHNFKIKIMTYIEYSLQGAKAGKGSCYLGAAGHLKAEKEI
jgi:hypothetical protein